MEKEIVGMRMVGDYIACSNGRIFKLNWGRTGRTREVKQSKTNDGYLMFTLNGKYMRSHRFIAMCFIQNPNNLLEVNHKNEIKTDNRVENLEWCTPKYNSNYGTRNNRISRNNIGNKINRPDQSIPISQFTKSGDFVATYSSINEARRKTGVNERSISRCCQGEQHYKTAGGFVWRFAD